VKTFDVVFSIEISKKFVVRAANEHDAEKLAELRLHRWYMGKEAQRLGAGDPNLSYVLPVRRESSNNP
jgi:hypothetical protein